MAVLDMIVLWLKTLMYFIYCFCVAIVELFKPPSRKSIAGEIALVTGAGHGIGRELALQIARLGATVVVWDINKENNEKTAEEIKAEGGKAFPYVCDVTKPEKISEVAGQVRHEVGEVGILVNNAGILNGAFIEDLEEKDIRRTFDVNVMSHFWMDREFLPFMKAKNKGHILNIISMASFVGSETLTDYCASKHAARGLASSLAVELRTQGYNGIKITSLCPMMVDTGLLRNFDCKISPVLTPEETARAGVDGMLRDYEIVTVPSGMFYSIKLTQLVPLKALHFTEKFGYVTVRPQLKKGD